MSATLLNDLHEVREFLSQKVDSQPDGLRPEGVLDQWRATHPLPDEIAESAAEIQQTLDEMSSSVGVPAREASAELRRSLGLRAKS